MAFSFRPVVGILLAVVVAACTGPTTPPTTQPPVTPPPATDDPATQAPATDAPTTPGPTDAPTTAAPSPADLGQLRVGIIPIAAMAPLHLAADEGLYEAHGVDVELIDIGFVDAIAVLESGEVDMILEITGGGLRAIQAGADIMAVYQNEIAHAEPPDTGAILVGADTGITDLAGLRGATIAVNSLASQEVVAAQRVMREAGVNPEDYEQVEIPFPNMPDAVGQGQVDAAVIIDPYTTVALESEIGTVLSWMFVETVPEQPIGVFWAKSDFVAQNSDALEAFANATTEAQDMLKADEQRARELVAQYAGLEPDIVSSMPLIVWDSEVDLDTWSALIDMLVAEEVLEPGLVVEDHLAEYMLAP